MANETDSTPMVPVRCEACETTSRVPLAEVVETVEGHNERVHGGEEIAEVDPDLADQVADLVARDIGLLDE